MFTIVVVIVVLAIIGEIFGTGRSSSGSSISNNPTARQYERSSRTEHKTLGSVKDNTELTNRQLLDKKRERDSTLLYHMFISIQDKFNYYERLIDNYHSLPNLECSITSDIRVRISSFYSKLKFESPPRFVFGFMFKCVISNYDDIKNEFNEIKALMTHLDNVFSQEMKTKERDYLVNILGQYGVTTINHMTHIDNLSSILGNGLISHNNPYCKRDISNQEVNARRERIEPIYSKKIHDYVPFYINIRNPMLYVVQKQQGDDIVILGYSPDILFEKNILFTDRNAATNAVRFTGDAFDLGNENFINMDRVFNIYGETLDKELKHIMQAEILVPEKVDMFLSKIYVQSEAKKKIVENEYNSLLKERNITVVVDEDLFF